MLRSGAGADKNNVTKTQEVKSEVKITNVNASEYEAPDMRSKVSTLLQHVTQGEQDQAEALLQKNPQLAFQKFNVTDFSCRFFENISAIQYAAWAYDTHMLKMLIKYANNDKKVYEHMRELETKGTKHEAHYDFSPLIKSIQTYVENRKEWKLEQRKNHWCKNVGAEQKLVPTHVANEYCYPDRIISTLDCADRLKVEKLKRSLRFGNREALSWYPLSLNPGLGKDFAITISRNDPPGVGRASRYPDAAQFLDNDAFYGLYDLAFLTELSKLRMSEYEVIRAKLLDPNFKETEKKSIFEMLTELTAKDEVLIGQSAPKLTLFGGLADQSENKKENKETDREIIIKNKYQEALGYFKVGEWLKTMKCLGAILKIDKYNAEAQFLVGKTFEVGVKDSLKKAIKWYSAAHANGHKDAEESLARAMANLSISDQAAVEKEEAVSSSSYKKFN